MSRPRRQLPLPDERVCTKYDDLCHRTGLSNRHLAELLGVEHSVIAKRRRASSLVRKEHLMALRVIVRRMERSRREEEQ